MNTIKALLVTLALLSVCRAEAAERMFKFMGTLGDAERAKPYVQAHSRTVPQDFVDGQWQGTLAASDGKIYFGMSCHSESDNAQFYSYDPATDAVRHIIDVGAWCGETDSIGKANTQGKIHSNIFEFEGKLYMSSTMAHKPKGYPYKGGHFLRYDLKTGECKDLGRYDDPGGGLLCMVLEPVYQRLYAISQTGQMLVYYDLKTGKIVTIGQVEENSSHTRNLIADKDGIVYGGTWDGMIYRYDPEFNTLSCLLTRVPQDPDPEVPRAAGPIAPPALVGYDRELGRMVAPVEDGPRHWTKWGPMLWDEETGWWYGVYKSQEYLFRFRPPKDRHSHIGAAEGLASMSFRPPKERTGTVSNGFGRKGRTLYYISYPVWQSQAHLTSYDMKTGVVTDHGPLVLEDGRRVSEMHAIVVGSDGKLYGPAMVWSIDGKDPANERGEAMRANCYIHCRLVIIDPDKDFQHAAEARTWQGKSAP